ncbi:MAG TPA: kynureninase [Clostridia bacterium]|nr:kynureninase [Clostridia bacterium]
MFKSDRAYAKKLDEQDALSDFREKFYLNPGEIYMDGNSLGLMSKPAERAIHRMLEEWKTLGIRGWLGAEKPWYYYSEELSKGLAPLVGASPEEVTVHASTTINIHNLISTMYEPTKKRYKILIDNLNFPTDRYAIESFLELQGKNLETHLKVVESRDGKTLDEDEIIKEMTDDVALILLPAVLYRSGQLLDIEKLTKKAHEKDIIIGFDCSHSAGVVNHQLSDHGVDFAMWSNYKYLNNGPGGASGLYLNKKHFNKPVGLAGWFGSTKEKQFDLEDHLTPSNDASGLEIGTPNLLSMAPLEGSLEIFKEAGIDRVREKSIQITDYFIYLIDEYLTTYGFEVGSPRESSRRGGHVALIHEEAVRINEALKDEGIVPDFRNPNVIRLAPVPLYISYEEVFDVVMALKRIMENKTYEKYDKKRSVVA